MVPQNATTPPPTLHTTDTLVYLRFICYVRDVSIKLNFTDTRSICKSLNTLQGSFYWMLSSLWKAFFTLLMYFLFLERLERFPYTDSSKKTPHFLKAKTLIRVKKIFNKVLWDDAVFIILMKVYIFIPCYKGLSTISCSKNYFHGGYDGFMIMFLIVYNSLKVILWLLYYFLGLVL